MNQTYTVHWYNRNDITDKGSQSGLDESEAIWLLTHGTFQRQLADYYYWSVPTLHAESTRVFTIRLGDEMAQRRVDVLEDENRRYKAALGAIQNEAQRAHESMIESGNAHELIDAYLEGTAGLSNIQGIIESIKESEA